MTKNMRFNTPAYSLKNGGTVYTVYEEKKTRHGITALLKTPGGNWIVANGLNKYSPMIDCEVNGDWNHGHYFMEHKDKAIRYFEEVV